LSHPDDHSKEGPGYAQPRPIGASPVSGIRVVTGVAKGRKLRMVPGDSTRPIGDRVKVSLFDILGKDVAGSRMLDLFAGTGSVGIEALSRGARGVVFVDNDPKAIETVLANLKSTGLQTGAEVIRGDGFHILERRPSEGVDYLYIAPPQSRGMWAKAVELVDENPAWLNPDAWVIAQIHPSEFRELNLKQLKLFDRRRYGSTELIFYELPGE
jgi:16S rRNA (guanine(966)-N(2))-methyltransferase RsmD